MTPELQAWTSLAQSTHQPEGVYLPEMNAMNRRQILSRASTGFGMAALAGLMQEESQAALVHRAKRFAPRARSGDLSST
jgi:hypothetical protein